jgi:hypothetical protein
MPTSNPRDVEEIIRSMDETYREVDPAIDSRKGPVAVIDYAVATELARTEDTSDYLRSLYQLGNPELLEDEDIVQLGLNYGKDPNIGRPSQVPIFLYKLSRPEAATTYTAEVGTLVSSTDGRFVYSLLDEASINGDFPDVYFNAATNRYEVSVLAEAIAVGVDYNLPPFTITAFSTPVEGFDGVENKDYATGGADPIDPNQFRIVIWDALRGIGSDLAGSILNLISDVDPTGFDDMALVPSIDYENFARTGALHSKLGYDVYLISDSIREKLQSGFTQGGETSIKLDKAPALSVRFVTLNGTEIPFSLQTDTDPTYAGSPQADDRVVFTSPLPPAQAYDIRYIYYDFVFDANEVLQDRSRPFETDVLVRRANPIEVIIVATLKSSSTSEREDLINEIRAFTIQYLRDPAAPAAQRSTFYELLDPVDYEGSVETAVNGVTDFRLDRFARIDKAFMDIDVVYFDGLTEYPVLSPQFDIQ